MLLLSVLILHLSVKHHSQNSRNAEDSNNEASFHYSVKSLPSHNCQPTLLMTLALLYSLLRMLLYLSNLNLNPRQVLGKKEK